MDMLNQALAAYPWGIYLCLVLGPFFQEDAAVIAAASASSIGLGDPLLLYASLIAGLSASDLWKYWAGRAALTQGWAHKFARRPGVQAARSKVLGNLAHTLMVVRFIPGTRIPTYLAAGFFKVPFGRFAFWVVLSGMLYGAITFGLFHFLGEVGGKKAKAVIPLVAIALLVITLVVKYTERRLARRKAASS